jgi:hypothetical protein
MTHPLVVHCKKSKFEVYIGRGSPYGNPYVIGRDGDRATVIQKFKDLRSKDPAFIAMVKKNLKGRVLGCFCSPEICHGDWLATIANEE